MQKIIIKNIEFEFDMFDVECVERYEKASEIVQEQFKALAKDKGKLSIKMRKLYNAVAEAFNELFGEGTSDKIFGDKINIVEVADAWYEFSEQAEQNTISSAAEINEKVKSITND